jgi:hypothetical protein
MMSLDEVVSWTENLSYAHRDQILGFATFVEEAADDLLEAAGVQAITELLIDQLVYAAGVWRLWQSINSQVSLLNNSLTLMAASGVDGVRLGGTTYTRNSQQYVMLTALRDDLRRVLRDSGLQFIPNSATLTELVRGVVQADGR